LYVAHCIDTACTTTTSTLVDAGNVGHYVSATTGVDGFGLFVHQAAKGQRLKVVHCLNAACSSYTVNTVGNGKAQWPSVAIGVDGLPLISYHTGQDLQVAHCSDASCSAAMMTTLDTGSRTGEYTSVTIGADGLGLISYREVNYNHTEANVKVAHCSNILCTEATINTLNSGNDHFGTYTSVTIGDDGLGRIIYRDGLNQNLEVAHCSNVICSDASITIPDGSGEVTGPISSAIGMDGRILVAYQQNEDHNLRVLHLSNTDYE
jgi:hypothetical protein